MKSNETLTAILALILIILLSIVSFMSGYNWIKEPPINNYDITVIVPATTVPPTVKPIPVY